MNLSRENDVNPLSASHFEANPSGIRAGGFGEMASNLGRKFGIFAAGYLVLIRLLGLVIIL